VCAPGCQFHGGLGLSPCEVHNLVGSRQRRVEISRRVRVNQQVVVAVFSNFTPAGAMPMLLQTETAP